MSQRKSSTYWRRFWQPDFPFSPKKFPFFYGWVILVVGTLGFVCSIPGQTMGVSVFTDVLIEHLGLTRMQLSMAYLIGTCASGFMLPVGGKYFDRVGSRLLTVFVCFGLGAVLLYLSVSDRIANRIGGDGWMVGFVVILVGFFFLRLMGQGLLTMASRAMIGKWFQKRRGLVMSLSGVAVSLTFSTTPWAFSKMMDAFGWRGAWWFMASVIAGGMALLAYLFYRDNPEECGLTMDGDYKGKESKKINLDAIIVRDFTRAETLRTLPFWVFTCGFSWWALFATGYAFHVVAIGSEVGVNKETILALFVPSAIVSMFVNLFTGYISDHVRVKYLLMLMCVGMFLCPLGGWLLPNEYGFILIVTGMGITGGTWSNLSGSVWPRFFGRTHLGAINGVFLAVSVIASGIGPALFAFFQDFSGGFKGMFLFGLTVPILLFVLSGWADNPQRKLAAANSDSKTD